MNANTGAYFCTRDEVGKHRFDYVKKGNIGRGTKMERHKPDRDTLNNGLEQFPTVMNGIPQLDRVGDIRLGPHDDHEALGLTFNIFPGHQ